jgi:hypothetical protein
MKVVDADIQHANLKDLIATLTLKSCEGLWMVPFTGLPAAGLAMPVDLVYLDDTYKVIDVVESPLTSHDAPLNHKAASVLVLPPHTIYSSQTQPGDLLAICMAGEMERCLEKLPKMDGQLGAVHSAALLRGTPLWSGGPGVLELEDRSKVEGTKSSQAHEFDLIEPGKGSLSAPMNWLKRWWSPDPRKAPRESASGLAAYYWTGATPVPHRIRDISASGLYLVTEERWYPGTLVLMTLQRTDCGEEAKERSIYVHSRAVRWGNDGVGLQFILPDTSDSRIGQNLLIDAVDRKELNRFLDKLKGKS